MARSCLQNDEFAIIADNESILPPTRVAAKCDELDKTTHKVHNGKAINLRGKKI